MFARTENGYDYGIHAHLAKLSGMNQHYHLHSTFHLQNAFQTITNYLHCYYPILQIRKPWQWLSDLVKSIKGTCVSACVRLWEFLAPIPILRLL